MGQLYQKATAKKDMIKEEKDVTEYVPKYLDSATTGPEGVIIDSTLKLEKEFVNNFTIKESLTNKTGFMNIEASNDLDGKLIRESTGNHGVLETVRLAHSYHVPLSFSPDHIWALINQGFCEHMELNHEQLRSQFVDFDGKKLIRIDRDEFVKGSDSNDWVSVFGQFSTQIRKNIGEENHDNLTPRFSTTTPTSQAVHELSLMNAMQNYFDYECRTSCGISKVKLLGELEDWVKLRDAVKKLEIYGLEWWTKNVVEILEKFIETYQGKPDATFWKYIYKYWPDDRISGAQPEVNGWILTFFPYINKQQSSYAQRSLSETITSFNTAKTDYSIVEQLNGISKTPFIWNYYGTHFKYNFISGFAGAIMTDDGYIQPQFGWGVAENIEKQ